MTQVSRLMGSVVKDGYSPEEAHDASPRGWQLLSLGLPTWVLRVPKVTPL